jgi:phospholipid transport system transporter-binding protein
MAEANPMLSLEALTFQSAGVALEQGYSAIDAGETVFDLGGVKTADSAGLAVMLAWQRRALGHGQRLKYINVPKNVHSLARVYGVDTLLPGA